MCWHIKLTLRSLLSLRGAGFGLWALRASMLQSSSCRFAKFMLMTEERLGSASSSPCPCFAPPMPHLLIKQQADRT